MSTEIVRELVDGEWVTTVAAGGGGGGVAEITSDDHSVTVTNPMGPTVDLSASGGSQAVQLIEMALSSADLLSLATQKVLVAGVPGKVIVYGAANLTYLAGTTPYTIPANAEQFYIGVGTTKGEGYTQLANTGGIFDGLDDLVVPSGYGGGSFGSSVPYGTVVGADLVVGIGPSNQDNPAANMTDGDGTAIISVTYTLMTAV